jgi:hypothetical protein
MTSLEYKAVLADFIASHGKDPTDLQTQLIREIRMYWAWKVPPPTCTDRDEGNPGVPAPGPPSPRAGGDYW